MKCILLIHGLLSDENDFEPLLEPLKMVYDCIKLITLPGHGKLSGVTQFTSEDTFSTVLNAYDELKKNYDWIDVAGYSMGGPLAMYLSNFRKINRLILLAPACRCFNWYVPITKVTSYVSIYNKLRIARKEKQHQLEINYSEKLSNIINDDKKNFVILKDRFFKFNVPIYFICYEKIVRKVNLQVKQIDVPTLILWGELDELVPKKVIKYILPLCKHENTKVIIYDDVCHLMLLSSKHSKIVSDIMKFIQE